MQLLSLLLPLLPFLHLVVAKADSRGICPTMYIRNTPSALLKLSGCRVIEGSLQISMIDQGTPSDYRNLSFPELKEITGYFLLFEVNGLQSLSNLFPNLSLIRAQEYLYDYGFIVNGMPDLIEIGLSSLTRINRGVFINNNPNLCYLDTIDWDLITNTSNENVVQKNKPTSECPNKCPEGCAKSGRDGRELCWTNTECQRVGMWSGCREGECRSGLCGAGGVCCSEQCLGGCSGSGPMDCTVCKNFENWNGDRIICMEHCEQNKLEYASRRCVTAAECSNITSYDARTRQFRRGKVVVGGEHEQNLTNCVLDCPPGYDVLRSDGGLELCAKCNGACSRECKSSLVDSSESSKALQGCTVIDGELKIQIRHYSANLMADLTANLRMITSIRDNLVIINSPFLTSLEFLKGLRSIGGSGDRSGFALEVKSNDNLRELFPNQTVRIGNPKARVQFHYNPKLCPTVIWEFVDKSGINRPVDNKIDIGTTNGDKVPCNQLAIRLYEVQLQQNSVTLKWDNFRTKLREPAHLLNYEIYYKKSPSQNASIYQERDVCGNDDWNVVDHPKLHFEGRIEDEPPFEEERIITGLDYYSQYAFYVKTVVIPIPDVNVTDLNVGGISSICYITTLPWIPSPPRNLKLSSPTPTSIQLEWSPPLKPNGVIEKYEIYVRVEETNTDFQNQRDYCLGRQEARPKKSAPEKPFPPFINSDCCTCSATPVQKSTRKSEAQRALQIKDVEDSIIAAVFVENPFPVSRARRSTDGAEEGAASDSSSAESHPVFPTQLHAPQPPSLSHSMVLNRTVAASTERRTGDFELTLSDLKHFTRYTIGVKACRFNGSKEAGNGCREKNSSIVPDPNLCSEIVKETITTLFDPALDLIPAESIRANVSGNRVSFSWAEPGTPNGMVMSYKVNVTRLGSGQYPPQLACITRLDYSKAKAYSLEAPLHPGNYSLQLQVLSLAPYEANFTDAIYFEIHSTTEGLSTSLLLAVLIPVFLLLLMAVGIGLYVVRTRLEINKIISANPEYLQNVDIPAEWEVGPGQVVLGKKLGKGSFGEVYLGVLQHWKGVAQREVAVKTVAENSSSEDRYRFLKEASIMTQLDCHHIVKLIAVVSLSRPTYVVMELMANGDLKEYLISRRPDSGGEPPTLRQILRMAAGIADGMAYLDDHKFVHRDLAARNCMVAQDLTVKVGDFGMTKDVVETDYYRKETRGFLPVRWMAPESIREGKFTIQSDVWSFGVVLWEMATLAAQPYQGLDNEQSLRYVRDGGVMERPHNCPEVLHSMMTRCWASSPSARPTFADILDWLMPELDASFAQVSFYHSAAGLKYREQVHSRPSPTNTNPSRDDPRAPLRATFDSESDSDSDAPAADTHFLHSKAPQVTIAMDTGANNNASAKVPNGLPRNGYLRKDRTTQC